MARSAEEVLELNQILQEINIPDRDVSVKGATSKQVTYVVKSDDRDGTKSGYDLNLLKEITRGINLPVIASGGVGNLQHLYEGIISGGASALLAASIFHYGEHTIKETKEYLKIYSNVVYIV